MNTPNADDLERAYYRGKRAYKNAQCEADCPYDDNSPLSVEWLEGFKDAEQDWIDNL